MSNLCYITTPTTSGTPVITSDVIAVTKRDSLTNPGNTFDYPYYCYALLCLANGTEPSSGNAPCMVLLMMHMYSVGLILVLVIAIPMSVAAIILPATVLTLCICIKVIYPRPQTQASEATVAHGVACVPERVSVISDEYDLPVEFQLSPECFSVHSSVYDVPHMHGSSDAYL